MLKDAFDWGRGVWQTDADAADEEAERRVAWALAHPEEPWLFLSDLPALRRLPPDLADCAHLARLDIGDAKGPDGERYEQPGIKRYEIESWAPLAALLSSARGAALSDLNLAYCRIEDLTPLPGAAGLQSLDLWGTPVSDLTPLSGAAGLQSLDLRGTRVSDLAPLRGAAGLTFLNLYRTEVEDLSPLLPNPAFTGEDPMEMSFGETPLARRDRWRDIAGPKVDQDTTRRAVALLLEEGHVIPRPPAAPARRAAPAPLCLHLLRPRRRR